MTFKSVSHSVVNTQRYLLRARRVPAQHLPPCAGQHPTCAHHPITASHNSSLDLQFPDPFCSRSQTDHSLLWNYTGAPWLQAIAGLIIETSWFFGYHNLAAQPPELLPTVRSQVSHASAAPSLMIKQLPTEFKARFAAIEKTKQAQKPPSAHNMGPWLMHSISIHSIFPSCHPSCPDKQSCSQGNVLNILQQHFVQSSQSTYRKYHFLNLF